MSAPHAQTRGTTGLPGPGSEQHHAPWCALNGQVHLWWFSLCLPPTALERQLAALTSGERTRLATMPPVAAARAATCRAAVRRLLGRYTGMEASALTISTSPHGKPRLADCHGITFSIAHCRDIGALAVSRQFDVGVDIEPSERPVDLEMFARCVLSEAEARRLASMPPQARRTHALRIWTRKEAVLKAAGTGLDHPLRLIDIDNIAQPLQLAGEQRCWQVQDIPLEHGRWLAAVAFDARMENPPIVARHYPDTVMSEHETEGV